MKWALLLGLLIALASTPAAQARLPSCSPENDIRGVSVVADNPQMMAIGDSLYNGVESLSITGAKAGLSIPKLVADHLSVPLNEPQYDRPILVDLDRELLRSWLDVVGNLGKNALTNIAANADPKNPNFPKLTPPTLKFFDNIAVAQADSVALICDNAGDADSFIAPYYPTSGGGPLKPIPMESFNIPQGVENWFYDLNSRFILNPTLHPQYNGLSQLDEVLLRKPRTLLINIGSNDGVWLMAFDGYSPTTCYLPGVTDDPIAPCGSSTTTVKKESGDLVANMGMIAQLLNRHSPQTKVLVNLLPRPSAAANLQPRGDARLASDQSYFANYENYFGTGGIRHIAGSDVKAMDDLADATNAGIVRSMCSTLGPENVAFVDLFSLLKSYDHKNDPAAKTVTVNLYLAGEWGPATLNNDIVNIGPMTGDTGFYLGDGGLFSYDNMHPTAFGYTLVANAVLNAIGKAPPASGCTVLADDTPQISYQSIAYRLHPPDGSQPPIPTALDIDGGTRDLLELVHALLVSENPSGVPAPERSATALSLGTGTGPSGNMRSQAQHSFHALFRMGGYPAARWHRHNLTHR